MSTSVSSNKRIAKNTVFLYCRMLLTMAVTLYTSRVILEQLGIEDYGIYSVVAGVVTMFSFLNNSMSTATQRYITYELGKGDMQQLKKVFAASLNIHIFIGIIIIIFAETIGLWVVNCKLVIPESRNFAANVAYQIAIVSFFINIIQVPYNATIIAHEHMSIYAYLSVVEVVLKLLIVYLLCLSSWDKLVVYSLFLLFVSIFIRVLYQVYCRRHFEECCARLFWEKNLYKKMTSFAGWNVFGSIAWILRGQGLDVLLNTFFGPAINAARGVSNQVSSAVYGFASNFMVALNPQITKNYAQGNIKEMETLAFIGARGGCLLLLGIGLPVMMTIDYILSIWLVEVPDYAASFVVLMLIDAIVGNTMGSTFITSLIATGNISKYQIVVSSIILLVIPLGYCALNLGAGATTVFYIMIAINAISGFVRILYCRKQIGFSLKGFFYRVVVPIFFTIIVALPIPIFYRVYFYVTDDFFSVLCLFLISFFSIAIFAFLIGFNAQEKRMLIDIVKTKIHSR